MTVNCSMVSFRMSTWIPTESKTAPMSGPHSRPDPAEQRHRHRNESDVKTEDGAGLDVAKRPNIGRARDGRRHGSVDHRL